MKNWLKLFTKSTDYRAGILNIISGVCDRLCLLAMTVTGHGRSESRKNCRHDPRVDILSNVKKIYLEGKRELARKGATAIYEEIEGNIEEKIEKLKNLKEESEKELKKVK